MRESKQRTSWLDPDPEYEARVLGAGRGRRRARPARRPGAHRASTTTRTAVRATGARPEAAPADRCPACPTPTRAASSSTSPWSTPTTAGRSTTTTAARGSRTCGDARAPRPRRREAAGHPQGARAAPRAARLLRRRRRLPAAGRAPPATSSASSAAARSPCWPPGRARRLEVVGGWGDATFALPEGLWRDELTGDAARRRRATAAPTCFGDLPGRAAAPGAHASDAPAIWAPRAGRVDLVLGDDAARRWAAATTAGGAATSTLADGDRYAFSLDGGDPRPDPRGAPAARRPARPVARRRPGGVRLDRRRLARASSSPGAVIYELHVGTFTPEGTLDAAAGRLPHLVDLGVDVVELLPLAPFPGRHSWGYDGVAPYAVHEPYGGPAALQRFVDAAHAPRPRGLPRRGLQPPRPRRELPRRDRARTSPTPTSPRGARRSTSTAPAATRCAAGCSTTCCCGCATSTSTACGSTPCTSCTTTRAAARCWRRCPARSTRSPPRPAGRCGWSPSPTATTPAPSPRAAPATRSAGSGCTRQWADDVHHALHVALTGETQGYYADFADPGGAGQGAAQRRSSTTAPTRPSAAARHGRPVDAATVPGWRFVGVAADPRPGRQPGPGRPALGAARSTPACSPAAPRSCSPRRGRRCCSWGRSGAPARRGSSSPTTPTPTIAAATAARPQGGVRLARLGRGRRPGPAGPGDVRAAPGSTGPSPTAEPHARLLRWYRDLIALRRAQPRPARRRPDRADVTWADRRLRTRRGDYVVLVNLGDEPWTCDDVPGAVLLGWEPDLAVDAGRSTYPRGAPSSWADGRLTEAGMRGDAGAPHGILLLAECNLHPAPPRKVVTHVLLPLRSRVADRARLGRRAGRAWPRSASRPPPSRTASTPCPRRRPARPAPNQIQNIDQVQHRDQGLLRRHRHHGDPMPIRSTARPRCTRSADRRLRQGDGPAREVGARLPREVTHGTTTARRAPAARRSCSTSTTRR